jgi:hypothetical protein
VGQNASGFPRGAVLLRPATFGYEPASLNSLRLKRKVPRTALAAGGKVNLTISKGKRR